MWQLVTSASGCAPAAAPRRWRTLRPMLTIVALILAFIFQPSPWNVIVVLVTAVVDTLETGAFVWWSRRRRRTMPAAVGVDSIVGRLGVAIGRLDSDWT